MKKISLILLICLLNANIYASYNSHKCETIKIHRTTTQTSPTANTWTNCSTFAEIASETSGNVCELNTDTETIDILQDGVYQFGGCVHVQNNTTAGFTSIEVLIRLLKNKGKVDEEEVRCSQRGFDQVLRGPGGEAVLSYNGTVVCKSGDTINLQYFTDRTDVDFYSNSDFENPVAYTLWLIRCGG